MWMDNLAFKFNNHWLGFRPHIGFALFSGRDTMSTCWPMIFCTAFACVSEEPAATYNGKTAAEWTAELKQWHPQPGMFNLGPAALYAIASLGPRAEVAVPTLIELLHDKDLMASTGAVLTLRAIGPGAKQATPHLAAIVESRQQLPMLRVAAAQALAEIGPAADAAIPVLEKALGDEDTLLRIATALAIFRISGRKEISARVTAPLVQDSDQEIRCAAGSVLAEVDPKVAASEIRHALQNPDAEVRADAAYMLWEVEHCPEAIIPELIRLLKSPNSEARARAIDLLGKLGPEGKGAEAALAALANDGNSRDQKDAADALRKINAKFLTLTGPAAEAEARAERRRIEGKWKAASAQATGTKAPEQLTRVMEWSFRGDRFRPPRTCMINLNNKPLGVTVGKSTQGAYRLDPTRSPKAVDFVDPETGEISRGIYQLEGDRLTLCVTKPGAKRPTEFKAPAGSECSLIVLERSKR
jgi:uncharacterized protein (TIGR03067 family)